MKRLLYIGGLGVSLGMLLLLGTGTLESASLHPVQEMEFSYGVIVRDIPRETKTLEIWVPLPREDGWQSISNLRVESPGRMSSMGINPSLSPRLPGDEGGVSFPTRRCSRTQVLRRSYCYRLR